jgi:hypothetical protein
VDFKSAVLAHGVTAGRFASPTTESPSEAGHGTPVPHSQTNDSRCIRGTGGPNAPDSSTKASASLPIDRAERSPRFRAAVDLLDQRDRVSHRRDWLNMSPGVCCLIGERSAMPKAI